MSLNSDIRALSLVMISVHLAACTERAPVPLPDIQLNQNPKERYEITVLVSEIATPPKAIIGKSSHALDNPKGCLPLDYTRAIGGVHPELYREQSQSYEQASTYVFRTYVYDDAFLNEDYYGLGVCDWGVQSVRAEIVIGSGTKLLSITNNDIKSGKRLVAYCPDNTDGDRRASCISSERFQQVDSTARDNFFKIEMQPRKISP